MTRKDFAESLSLTLSRTLTRLGERRERPGAPLFPKLAQRAEAASARFGGQAAPPAPPQQQRIDAFAKLRRAPDDMGIRDWRLIAWGLSDECGRLGRAFDDAALFPQIEQKFQSLREAGNLSRKMWFGLISSYFSYRPESAVGQKNWVAIRKLALRSFEDLKRRQTHARKWTEVVGLHLDVFSDTPGARLGKAIAAGQKDVLADFQHTLQVPPQSWLWKSVVEEQLRQAVAKDDAGFVAHIDPLLQFATLFPSAADTVLGGLLTRYAESRTRDQPHKELKNAALEHWGSPQLGSARNRWTVNVSDTVCKMVMRWFAKEDLETFFKLLQGESGVDQDRLDYWLRFVGQIGFTRIVLGTNAATERSQDFVEFRTKNAQRIGNLRGGTAEDNAFMMKIGPLLIVEFSRKGNACYVRPEGHLPYALDQRSYDLNGALKAKSPLPFKWPHTPTNCGWWYRFDAELARFGIRPDTDQATRPHQEQSKTPLKQMPAAESRDGARLTGRATPSRDHAIAEGRAILGDAGVQFRVSDNRIRGGAFWFITDSLSLALDNKLAALGFRHTPGRGYWIK